MTAWHLSEWIFWEFEEQHFTNHKNPKENVREFQNTVVAKCPSIKLMNDIADGSKHYKLRSNRRIETELHNGEYSNQEYSREYDISILKIKQPDGTTLFFEDEIQTVINFWKDYFENLGISLTIRSPE
jgi:hypothetical protein